MKVLMLNGSPKARGNTADVAKAYAFLAAMKPGPAETIIKTLE